MISVLVLEIKDIYIIPFLEVFAQSFLFFNFCWNELKMFSCVCHHLAMF